MLQEMLGLLVMEVQMRRDRALGMKILDHLGFAI